MPICDDLIDGLLAAAARREPPPMTLARSLALPTSARPWPRMTPRLGRARRFLSPLVIVLLWQLASQTGLVSNRLVAAPDAILVAAWNLAASGELLHHLLVSLRRVS